MKTSPFAAVVVILGGLLPLVAAQEPLQAPAPPPLIAAAPAPTPLTAPPTAELSNLWNSTTPGSLHVSGDLSMGVYSGLGRGSGCGPLYGTSGSVSVFGPNMGVTVGGSSFTGSQSGAWNTGRRP